jgi:hypothetical protein
MISFPAAKWAPVAAIAAALSIAAFVLYWPTLDDFFALDDFIWLKQASNPSAADYLRRAFTFPPAGYFDPQTPFWRPLIDVYFFVAWRVFDEEPVAYHIVNVALHGAIAALLAALVWQLTQSWLKAFLAALLFTVLPTYDIAVTWISSATELFGAFFYLLMLVLFGAYLRGGARRSWCYGTAAGALLFALLSKESAISAPAALAGLTAVLAPPRSARDVAARVRELAPFFALGIAYFVFLYVQEYRASTDGGSYKFGWHARTHLWDYLKWLALPILDERLSWVEGARPYAASAFLTLGSASIALRSPRAVFAFGWTLAALLPYAFFVQGIEYRYSYLACIPFAMFLVVLVSDAAARLPFRLSAPAPVAATALVLALCVFSAIEARDRQGALSLEAEAYRQVYEDVPALCGELPPDSSIYMIYDPAFDLFQTSTRMALNLTYERVSVYRTAPDDLVAFRPNVCVVDYVGGHFVLVDRH